MPKWTQTDVNSKAYGTVSFGQDTDQSVSVDPFQLDSLGVIRLAAAGASSYDTTIQRSAAGSITINNLPIGASATTAGAGATVTGTTAETVLATGLTVAANGLATGQVYHFVATGTMTTSVDTDTVELRLRFGGVGGTLVLDFGVQNPSSGATITNAVWRAEFNIIMTSATNMVVSGQDALNFFPSGTTGQSTTVSAATAKAFALTVQPSDAALSMTCTAFYCERTA